VELWVVLFEVGHRMTPSVPVSWSAFFLSSGSSRSAPSKRAVIDKHGNADRSNSLIQLSPDFNWTPQIVERVNFVMFLFPWNCYLCFVFGQDAYLHFQRKIGSFHLRNVVPTTLADTAAIKFTTHQHFRCKWTVFKIFRWNYFKIKILNLSNLFGNN
jgi:hypothetical protein